MYFETGNFKALAEYINRNYDGLKETVIMLLNGGRQKVNVDTFQNDITSFKYADDVLTLLIHLGYLGYDADNKEVFIPNREIREGFKHHSCVIEKA